jgi:antitoxin VapB
MATTAKVFKSGGSQAVRIPKEYRIASDTVLLDRSEEGLLIRPAVAPAKRVRRAAPRREPGFLKGLKVPADFDAPLPRRVLRGFEQR